MRLEVDEQLVARGADVIDLRERELIGSPQTFRQATEKTVQQFDAGFSAHRKLHSRQ
jgi:hypothetical protein